MNAVIASIVIVFVRKVPFSENAYCWISIAGCFGAVAPLGMLRPLASSPAVTPKPNTVEQRAAPELPAPVPPLVPSQAVTPALGIGCSLAFGPRLRIP